MVQVTLFCPKHCQANLHMTLDICVPPCQSGHSYKHAWHNCHRGHVSDVQFASVKLMRAWSWVVAHLRQLQSLQQTLLYQQNSTRKAAVATVAAVKDIHICSSRSIDSAVFLGSSLAELINATALVPLQGLAACCRCGITQSPSLPLSRPR